MYRTLKHSLKLAVGHYLWMRNPDAARRLIISRKTNWLGVAALQYYLYCIVPQQAANEFLVAPSDDPVESLVGESDFQAVKELFASAGFQERGICSPEAPVLSALVRKYKPTVVLESGTYRGQSAMVVCDALNRYVSAPRFHTIAPNLNDCLSVARARLRQYAFAEVIEGYSQIEMRPLLKRYGKERIGVFIDGPKANDSAFTDLLNLLDESDAIDFIAIHDCEFPRPIRSLSEYPTNMKYERLCIDQWYNRSRFKESHDLYYLGTPWCNRHAAWWDWRSEEFPDGPGPHIFSNNRQLSLTVVL